MILRQIEARIAKLEADPRYSRLARMSEEELEAQIIRGLNILAEGFSTYDALADELAASTDPAVQEGAGRLRDFLSDLKARHSLEPRP